MTPRFSLLVLILLPASLGGHLAAQTRGLTNQVVGTTGQTSADGAIIVSWTIGEPMVVTLEHPSFVLTQGFHQPIDPVDWMGNGIAAVLLPQAGGVVLYPNPASEAATFDLPADLVNLSADVINEAGVTVTRYELRDRRTVVDVSSLPSGRYIIQLRTLSDNSFVATLRLTVQR